MFEFFRQLFDTDGFQNRFRCTSCNSELFWLHVVADLAVFGAYCVIPFILLYFVKKRQGRLPFHSLFIFFALFIVSCGFGHAVDAYMWHAPVYRFFTVVKVITAAASWLTVFALIKIMPKALVMRNPAELEEEIQSRMAQSEKALREHAHQLYEANRLKNNFLATLGHELRNPLAPILTGLQVMQVAPPESKHFKQAVGMMERQVKQMVRLIDDLLDVSRITNGKIELRKSCNTIGPIVEQAIEMASPILNGSAHILETKVDALVEVDVDPARIVQVINNLLNNAAKYTPEGGHVWLKAYKENDQAVISIKDDGIGIPKDKLESIFDLFVQVDRSLDRNNQTGGLGIGLTLVRKIIEMHGGSVTCHSDGPNQGSEFVVRLPLANAPIYKPAKPKEDQKSAHCKVLVVDDNVDAANSLGMLLGIQGHEVLVAHHGLAALEIYKVFQPDIVIQDIGMPGMDGYAICKKMREHDFDATIVALTGYGQEDDRRRTREAGFNFHLTKPVDFPDLERILNIVCKNKHDARTAC